VLVQEMLGAASHELKAPRPQPMKVQEVRKGGCSVRLATYLWEGQQITGVELDGGYLPLKVLGLPEGMREFLSLGRPGLDRLAAALRRGAQPLHRSSEVRLLSPVPDPRKIICVGLNYRDHARESGAPIPEEPVLFSKFGTALVGPEDPIVLPPVSQEVDYEAELVVVIGRGGRFIPVEKAMEHVAGYSCGHDVSARDWQLRKPGKQWLCGKSFDTFAPVGPVLVTAEQIPDPHNLAIRLRLNGQVMQDSNTREFIFRVEQLVAYISQVFSLEPGDLIFTGTPPGVGFARKPPVFLKPGDVCEVEIEGIGVLRNPVIGGSATYQPR
jgi:2-keto-4-pentenoate hydratase/2-oxohepta-3-ene-1,7-dioic acid hydratase in catechol pathway